MMLQSLSTAILLDVWEAGKAQTLTDRSLHLLMMACQVTDKKEVAMLTIGQRDTLLLQLRERLFGPRLLNKTACPACAMPLEWETDCQDLYLQPPGTPGDGGTFEMETEGYRVWFRLPNSLDLMTTGTGNPDHSEPDQLLLNCILKVEKGNDKLPAAALPETVISAIDQRMSDLDPQADIQMLLSCSGCAHEWEMPFDIAHYLWMEIDNWAARLLQEVVILSRALGWSENEILRLSPQRRNTYIEMVQS